MKPTDTSNPEYFHKVVDCQWGCPAHTDVPAYIRMIAQFSDGYVIGLASPPVAVVALKTTRSPFAD